MVQCEVRPSGLRILRDPGAEVHLWRPTPTLLYWAYRGHGSPEMIRRLCAEMDVLVGATPRFHLFNDNERMTGYDVLSRTLMIEWMQRQGERLECTHLLTRSRLVAMGVTIARLVLGPRLKLYADRGSFERAFVELGGEPSQLEGSGERGPRDSLVGGG